MAVGLLRSERPLLEGAASTVHAEPQHPQVSPARRFRTAVPTFEARWTIPAGALELGAAYEMLGLTQEAFDRRFTRLAALSERTARG